LLRTLRRAPVLIAVAAVVCSCAANESLPVYKLYPGPPLDESALVTIRTGGRVFDVYLDGLSFSHEEYDRVQLWPGIHAIRWQGNFRTSDERYSAYPYAKSACVEIELEQGVHYRLRAGHPESPDLARKLWIEHEDTGAVLYATDGFEP